MKNREYLSVWRQRETEENKKRDSAIEKAKSIATVLKEEYHAREVILFGSLIWRRDFLWAGTDIDLMVKGLKSGQYFEILAHVSTLAHPFHLDLIPFEKAEPSIKKRVTKEGLRLE
jgi:predicted nucleotidyltransferase